jgi:peptidoglycan/LPS O-acetylase OafA/YrhL
MEATSLLPAAAIFGLALATSHGLQRWLGSAATTHRYAALDGLRGYLAIAVFIHHACTWFFYLHRGRWELPPSNVYTNLGQAGVAMFFMLTAFLFTSKLIDARGVSIDWTRLYVGRLLRIVPLYFFFLTALFVLVAWLSAGQLREPAWRLVGKMAMWASFTLFGTPGLNGIVHPQLTGISGMVWTLRYEWLFYAVLPLLALPLRVRIPPRFLLVGVLGVAGMLWLDHIEPIYLSTFLGGIAAAFLVRWTPVCRFAIRPVSSVLAIALIATELAAFPSTDAVLPLLLLAAAFVLLAAGNTLFGLLTLPASHRLGEMSYSIYLLHCMLLFLALDLAPSPDWLAWKHWLVVLAVTPVLVVLCACTYRWIERPGMAALDPMMARLRRGRHQDAPPFS